MRARGPETQLDWLGVISIWLGAALWAIKSAGLPLMSGAPAFLTSRFWDYVPLALLTLAVGIWLYRLRRPADVKTAVTLQSEDEDADPNWGDKLELVHDKYFTNQEVLLDGKKFLKCEFHNVTFVYNGGPISLGHCTFGACIFRTNNQALRRFSFLLLVLGYIKSPLYTEGGPATREEVEAMVNNGNKP